MKRSVKIGLSFGLTSGVITPLGLMMGLNTSTGLKLAVIGGIITVALADAFSDALGIHMSEESNSKTPHKEVWESTFAAFFAKFFIALSFVVPLILFNLTDAIIVNIIWGLLLLIIFNYVLAKQNNEKPHTVIFIHLSLAVAVLIASYFVGKLVAITFGSV